MALQRNKTPLAVGLDFGTTNSALAVAQADGSVKLTTLHHAGTLSSTFRSVLYFAHPDEDAYDAAAQVVAGPQAIQRYLEAEPKGRFLQSIKSFLASRQFERTRVFNRAYTLEDLIALLLRALRAQAEAQFGALGTAVVIGRPVYFAGARDAADEALALQRLEAACRASGFTQVLFEFEPVAAAYAYGLQLGQEEVVLIADCGGGTSDLSLLKMAPATARSALQCTVLGTDGVAMGGDTFDSMLMRHLVAPHLGLGMQYRSFDKLLPVPSWLYSQLERWDHLWFLNTRSTLELLRVIRQSAVAPEKIERFVHVITQELGYPLSRAVESTKLALSADEVGQLRWHDPPVALAEAVTRSTFEHWIQPSLQALETAIDRLLGQCDMAPEAVDCVFLTGGSSFVPAIRQLFARKFAVARMRRGGELTSVARGLALRAQHRLA